MRTKLGLGLMASLAVAVLAAVPPMPPAAPQPPEKAVVLLWDHPAGFPDGNTNWQYRIYSSPDLTNWTALTNVNGGSNSIALSLKKAQWFFYATTIDTSNFWLESDPSNVALTPAPPQGGRNLAIKLGAQ